MPPFVPFHRVVVVAAGVALDRPQTGTTVTVFPDALAPCTAAACPVPRHASRLLCTAVFWSVRPAATNGDPGSGNPRTQPEWPYIVVGGGVPPAPPFGPPPPPRAVARGQ